jgi:hypothetical protein
MNGKWGTRCCGPPRSSQTWASMSQNASHRQEIPTGNLHCATYVGWAMFAFEQMYGTGGGRLGRQGGWVCPSAESRMDTGLNGCRTDWTGIFSNFFKKMDIGIGGKKGDKRVLAKFAVQAVRGASNPIKTRVSADGHTRPAPRPVRPHPVRGSVAP